MGYMDHTLKKTVPYYSTMKRAGAFKQQEPRKRQKRTTLTEYSQNGQKAVLKPHVTVNQAAKKLYDYEQTGLSPHEVANLVEQVQNLTRRVKKYESWEEWIMEMPFWILMSWRGNGELLYFPSRRG